MKIAIIGGGWAGVVMARCLHERCNYELTIFEKAPALGGMVGVGELYGVPIDMGPHVYHSANAEAWEWVEQFGEFHIHEDYRAVSVLDDGEVVQYPPSPDRWDFQPVDLGREPETLYELALSKWGQEVWDRMLASYTARLWGMHPQEVKLWPFVSTGETPIPMDRKIGYPVPGWRDVIGRIWPRRFERRAVCWQDLIEDFDLIVDTSPLLPEPWVGNDFCAWEGQPGGQALGDALGEGLELIYYAGPQCPTILRSVNQSRISGGKGARDVFVTQLSRKNIGDIGSVLRPYDCTQVLMGTHHAYPLPGQDEAIKQAWTKLPGKVWPFGRGGLHVYDNMAQVVLGAKRLAGWITNSDDASNVDPGYKRMALRELRAIVGGWL